MICIRELQKQFATFIRHSNTFDIKKKLIVWNISGKANHLKLLILSIMQTLCYQNIDQMWLCCKKKYRQKD